MSFKHRSLDRSVLEVRIIRVQPLTRTQRVALKLHQHITLSCTISHVVITDDEACPVFNALSYTWGSHVYRSPGAPALPDRTILVDGATFKVSENLWQFLSIAAQKTDIYSVALWIDQISINQTSNTERNYQVQRMGEIYRKATKVFMWLGPSNLATDFAIAVLGSERKASQAGRLLQSLPDPHAIRCKLYVKNSSLLDPPSDRVQTGYWRFARQFFKLEGMPFWAALKVLLNRTYWSRLWIVSEVLCGSQMSRHVLCGSKVISFVQFSNSTSQLFTAANFEGDEASPALKILQQLNFLPSSKRASANGSHHSHIGSMLTATTQIYADDALHLMSRFAHSNCTDSRDHIYGLLSLVRPEHRIKVRYDLAPFQTMVLLAAFYQQVWQSDFQSESTEIGYISVLPRIYNAVIPRASRKEGFLFRDIVNGDVRVMSLYNARYMCDLRQHCWTDFAAAQRLPPSEFGPHFEPSANRPELTCQSTYAMADYILQQVPYLDQFASLLGVRRVIQEGPGLASTDLLVALSLRLSDTDISLHGILIDVRAAFVSLNTRLKLVLGKWHLICGETFQGDRLGLAQRSGEFLEWTWTYREPADILRVILGCLHLLYGIYWAPKDSNAVPQHGSLCSLKPWQGSHDPVKCGRQHLFEIVIRKQGEKESPLPEDCTEIVLSDIVDVTWPVKE